jgi:Fe-S-cluster-containing dehydrogenase component
LESSANPDELETVTAPMNAVKGEAEGESKKAGQKKAKRKRRRLKVAHPERCIGCLSCMFACSRINTGRASLDRSAINVRTQGGLEGDFAVVVCHACKDPPCVAACPTGALEQREGGRVVFHRDLCQGCGACADACLIRAISLDAEGKAIKCKHCGACVAFCPHGVLEMEEVDE